MIYDVWQHDEDVQVVPEGEEHLHMLDVICNCNPSYKKDGIYDVTTHNSYLGEVQGVGFMHTVRQRKDC